jgi:hypothetical protein
MVRESRGQIGSEESAKGGGYFQEHADANIRETFTHISNC